MITAQDVPKAGRSRMLLLHAQTFEEERILLALAELCRNGGQIVIRTATHEYTAEFNEVEIEEDSDVDSGGNNVSDTE